MEDLINLVKKKSEFQNLPDSIVEKALNSYEIQKIKDSEEKVKETRAFLRKYFTVFITNKLIGAKISGEEILNKHMSSKNRDYEDLYEKLDLGDKTIVDLGAGLNGFSYPYFASNKYVAVEAIKVFVDVMNNYFQKDKLNAVAHNIDLFNLASIKNLVKSEKSPIVFLFNVIDALEKLERDYSKKLLTEIVPISEKVVLSFPTRSLTGKSKFYTKRDWIIDFIQEKFEILDDFEQGDERFIVFRSFA
ncbi:Uncharacterised protein [uncultured archaeon]|nr:Uncharacterised protein [uncultured archaeon]